MADLERIMRSRHGLKLDQPDDFDLLTQDAFLKIWDGSARRRFSRSSSSRRSR